MDKKYTYWVGWLIQNMGQQKDQVFDELEKAIASKRIPMYGNRGKDGSVEIKSGKQDMWWRRDTPCLTVRSQMDGTVEARVIAQDYGTSLWVCVVLDEEEEKNWAKAMAFLAFYRSLQTIVSEVVNTVGVGQVIETFSDKDLNKAWN